MISIIVPVFNAQAYLPDTIAMVKRQTYPDWELILVDDCSKDRSCAIIEEMAAKDSRIRLIRQEMNQGAAKARNCGVRNAKGRSLCFLDSDDLWESDKLSSEISFMQKKQAGFVFTGYEFADESGQALGKIVKVPEQISYSEALKNTTIFTSTVMIDRVQIEDEDIFNACDSLTDISFAGSKEQFEFLTHGKTLTIERSDLTIFTPRMTFLNLKGKPQGAEI